MRFEGSLVKWNANRGFGFIAPSQGGADLFIHVSAFPRDGLTPVIGEPLSFEIELDRDSRKRAVGIHRPSGTRPGHKTKSLSRKPRHDHSPATKLVAVILLLALGAFSWSKYAHRVDAYAPGPARPAELSLAPSLANAVNSRCDGRTSCAQMASCTEAKYFLYNCPATQMDGDHDGVPCEQQWCTSSFAR